MGEGDGGSVTDINRAGDQKVHTSTDGSADPGVVEQGKGFGRKLLAPLLGALKADENFRRIIGGIMGVGGLAVIGYVLHSAPGWLDNVKLPDGNQPPDERKLLLALEIAKLIAHAGVSIAIAYFGYALLRGAERMFVPRALLSSGGDPVEMVKVLVGIEEPIKAATKAAKQVLQSMQPVLDKLDPPKSGD